MAQQVWIMGCPCFRLRVRGSASASSALPGRTWMVGARHDPYRRASPRTGQQRGNPLRGEDPPCRDGSILRASLPAARRTLSVYLIFPQRGSSEHELDDGEVDHGLAARRQCLVVLAQAAVLSQPGKGAVST
jgi:hypothetical protein